MKKEIQLSMIVGYQMFPLCALASYISNCLQKLSLSHCCFAPYEISHFLNSDLHSQWSDLSLPPVLSF